MRLRDGLKMDLWPAYLRESTRAAFGAAALRLKTGTRHHTSLAMVEERATDLELNKAHIQDYSDTARYVTAREITYDLFISIYDVDTGWAASMRPSQHVAKGAVHQINKAIRAKGHRNLEMRVIGMQGPDPIMQSVIDTVRSSIPCRLAELDLFGNQTRHIALDLKTGSSYDLLLNNKVYGPAELITKATQEEFAARRSELAFV